MDAIAFSQQQLSSRCETAQPANQSKNGKRKKRQMSSNPAGPIKPTNRSTASQLAAMRACLPDDHFNCGEFKSFDKHQSYQLDASCSSKLFYSTPTKVSHLASSNLLDSTCSSIYSSSSSTSVNSNHGSNHVHDNNNLIMLAHYAVKELEKYERPSTATSSN